MKYKLKTELLILGLVIFMPTMGWAAIYEINPGESIQAAVDQAEPGDTVLIRGGRYYEAVRINRSGLEGQPITIKAYTGEEVILDGRQSVTGWKRCTETNEFLTVQGDINENWDKIYELKIHGSQLPSDIDTFMLFEDGIHSRIARNPDQVLGYGPDVTLFDPVAPEAYGQTEYLLDTTRLTQSDDYWAGAWVDIYSHAANAVVLRSLISSNSNNRLYFDEPLGVAISHGTTPDSYSIVNHPHVLDSPGEFAHTMAPDANGDYTFYLWPINPDNLEDMISIAARNFGIYSLNNNYITIDSLSVIGFRINGIKLAANIGRTFVGGIVRNCIVEDTVGTGILLELAINSTVENCVIKRAEQFGIYSYGNSSNDNANVIIQDNYIEATSRSSIYLTGMNSVRIVNNTVKGAIGAHGNGIAAYEYCERVLVAYNTFLRSNLAFNRLKDLVVFGNTVNREELGGSCIVTWANDDTYVVSGHHLYLHNDALGHASNSALGVAGRNNPPYFYYYVINNVIDGMNSWREEISVDRSYNLYTGYGWAQVAQHNWALNDGEIDGRNYSLDEIFNGPGRDAGNDYSLVDGSPVIGKGKDITALLDSLGITGDDPWFPGFDFTKDKAGNYWANPPSMGAYEYGSGGTAPNPEPDPGSDPEPEVELEPEDDPGSIIPDKTLLRISNNVIKSRGNQAVTINCDVKEAGTLTVKIYDSKGSEIITLWNGFKEAGPHSFLWTGVDDSGNKIGSGIYMVYMQAGSYKETKKIAVIK